MIIIKHSGSFKNTETFLRRMKRQTYLKNLEHYAEEAVQALSEATPVDSGDTANSWSYEIIQTPGKYEIQFLNSNVVKGVPIAIILQYGHGTGTGGYVAGRDYINPALQPVFDRIANDAWKEVTR